MVCFSIKNLQNRVKNRIFFGEFLHQKFLSNDYGAAIAEFAIVVPLIILLIFGALNLGFVMFITNVLEAGVREAARYGITGQSQTGLTRDASIKAIVLNTLSVYSNGLIDPSLVTITVKAYPDLASIGNPEPFIDAAGKGYYVLGDPFTDVNKNGVWDADMGVVGSFGLGGQAVLYQISYVWDTIIPIFGTSSLVTIVAKTPVVNEAF